MKENTQPENKQISHEQEIHMCRYSALSIWDLFLKALEAQS